MVEHLRSDEACGMRDWRLSFDPGEGFEDPQYESLKRRKISEWNQIFRILFPGDDETGYPPQRKPSLSALNTMVFNRPSLTRP